MILIEKADDLKSYLKDNFKAIFTVFIVLAGIVIGIILANNPQILKSRADTNSLVKINANNPPDNSTLETNSSEVEITIDPALFPN